MDFLITNIYFEFFSFHSNVFFSPSLLFVFFFFSVSKLKWAFQHSPSLSRKRISFRSDEEAEKEREKKKRREKRREEKDEEEEEKRREPQRRRSKRPSARTANDDRQNWKHTKRREPAPTQNETKRNAFHLLGRREKNTLEGKNQVRDFSFWKKKRKKEEEKLCRLFQKKICPQLQASSFEIIVAILLSPAIER